MKARTYRPWDSLPPSEKKVIAKLKEDEINQELVRVQIMMLKIACILLNRKPFGLGAMRLTLWLGGWNEVYRLLGKLSREEQDEYLDAEMARIFKKRGFPYQYIKKLSEM